MENNNEMNNLEKGNKNNINKVKNNKKKLWIIISIIIIAIVGTIVYAKVSEYNWTGNKTNRNSNNGNNNSQSYDGPGLLSPAKPIIYLYPQETTEITVKLGILEKITCSYPEYKEEWKVVAEPDGTLTDVKTQRKLYALYWEGKDMTQPEMTEGFIVKGEDTIEFLEKNLRY